MNEVTQVKSNLPSVQTEANEPILRSDIMVPYLVIGQGMSESVKERKAQIGDILRSTNFEKLGDPDTPLDIIFLHYPKSNWIYEQKTGNRFEYRRTEPRTAANETLEWYFYGDKDGNELPPGTPGGSEWRRLKQLLVFAILPKDIVSAEAELKKIESGDLPDPTKALTPILVSFRSMSYKAGKEVSTFFTQAKSMRVPIHRYMLQIGAKMEQNDDGSFYIWSVDRTRPKGVSKEHLPLVQQWVDLLNQGAVNIQAHNEAEGETYGNMDSSPQGTPTEVC